MSTNFNSRLNWWTDNLLCICLKRSNNNIVKVFNRTCAIIYACWANPPPPSLRSARSRYPTVYKGAQSLSLVFKSPKVQAARCLRNWGKAKIYTLWFRSERARGRPNYATENSQVIWQRWNDTLEAVNRGISPCKNRRLHALLSEEKTRGLIYTHFYPYRRTVIMQMSTLYCQ